MCPGGAHIRRTCPVFLRVDRSLRRQPSRVLRGLGLGFFLRNYTRETAKTVSSYGPFCGRNLTVRWSPSGLFKGFFQPIHDPFIAHRLTILWSLIGLFLGRLRAFFSPHRGRKIRAVLARSGTLRSHAENLNLGVTARHDRHDCDEYERTDGCCDKTASGKPEDEGNRLLGDCLQNELIGLFDHGLSLFLKKFGAPRSGTPPRAQSGSVIFRRGGRRPPLH